MNTHINWGPGVRICLGQVFRKWYLLFETGNNFKAVTRMPIWGGGLYMFKRLLILRWMLREALKINILYVQLFIYSYWDNNIITYLLEISIYWFINFKKIIFKKLIKFLFTINVPFAVFDTHRYRYFFLSCYRPPKSLVTMWMLALIRHAKTIFRNRTPEVS